MALSKERVKQLENTPGIDQTLLNTYKKNNPGSTPSESVVTEDVDPATRINNLSAALNVAVGKAREARQDSTLDFLNGIIPPGALPATSFAGVLSAFDADSAPLEATLIDSASNFAQQELKLAEEKRNQIRELGLAVAEVGGSKEALAAVLSFSESGDIDGALKAAGATLAAASGDIRTIGGNLVKVNKDGTYKVLYTAPKSGDSSTTTTAPDGSTVYNDTTGLSKTKAIEYIKSHTDPQFYATLIGQHSQEEVRNFYEYWMTKNAVESMTIRADLVYSEWLADMRMQADSIGIEEKGTKKTEKPEENIYSVTGIEI